ncbi:MAG: bifunctional phosphoribosylaminoimidazolecarboxamide formyltransferase/IMP cyclohydrolase [Epulopiscium sp.]|nr:bifunctional phosphoribosylaminoimidazolecarboxamide formyltransferase/IMP cyclohydrolase [Candidatus Epulonipiscium sp.]
MRALISVSDKTGIIDFAKELSHLGVDIISTGGTAKALAEGGIPVTEVSELTGFTECLDGRVKTLHPAIHAGILHRRDNKIHQQQMKELGYGTIDLVVVNLYPFQATISKPNTTLEEAIENIDIGGPTMLRAAAKNHQDVVVLVDPSDYMSVIEELKNQGHVSSKTKFRLASKVYEHTAYYDSLIATYFREQQGEELFPEKLTLAFEKMQDMRYGENPHQKAAFYKETMKTKGTLAEAKQLHGKELSYNNINDANGALELLKEFETPTIVAVKHANPCGVASADRIAVAYKKAYDSDPTSIFGGIVVANGTIDVNTAKEMSKTFLEIIIAPAYEEEALTILKEKKNLRILELPEIRFSHSNIYDMKKVQGGLIIQEKDVLLLGEELKVVTNRQPTEQEMEDLLFAWKVVKHVKSNGIAIAKDQQTIGSGGGQTNRIWAVEQAIEHGVEFFKEEGVRGSVLASDAFFPFKDCVEVAAKAGITAIIQPGGSIRDEESIEACNEHGIAMIFTGMRHFKH